MRSCFLILLLCLATRSESLVIPVALSEGGPAAVAGANGRDGGAVADAIAPGREGLRSDAGLPEGDEATTPSIKIPLWPIYYESQTAAGRTREALWPMWSQSEEYATGHRLWSFFWPLTRFSSWEHSGDYGHYVFPVFWGRHADDGNGEGEPTVSLYSVVAPLVWWWSNRYGVNLIAPPFWRFQYPDGAARTGVFPVFWRERTDGGAHTILAPFWWSTTAPEAATTDTALRAGGMFPLLWYYLYPQHSVLIAPPGWYSSNLECQTWGLLPLGWRNVSPQAGTSYTNIAMLYHAFVQPNRYQTFLLPLAYFAGDAEEESVVRMVLPFWYGANPERASAFAFPFAWSYSREQQALDRFSVIPLYWRLRDMGVEGPLPLHNSDGLFPLYGRNTGPGEDQGWEFYGFPLFIKARNGAERVYHAPFPLAGWRVGPDAKSAWLLPLAGWKRQGDGSVERWMLMRLLGHAWSPEAVSAWFVPLFHWSRRQDVDSVVGSALVGSLGFSRTPEKHTFWFYPLFERTRQVDDGSVDGTLLMGAGGWKRTASENSAWLLPLFRWARLPEKDSVEAALLMGLLGYFGHSPQEEEYGMFPLFRWRRQEGEKVDLSLLLGLLARYSRQPQPQRSVLSMGAGLMRHERTPEKVESRLLGLYGYERSAERLKWSALLSLLAGERLAENRRYSKLDILGLSWRNEPARKRFSAPLFAHETRFAEPRASLEDTGEVLLRRNTLFPLSYYSRRPQEDKTRYAVLDPLAYLEDGDQVKRHYSALFHLFDYKRMEDGTREWRVFWKGFHRTKGPAQDTLEMFPFIDREKGDDRYKFSVGWRLFEYQREQEDKSLRLFFLPAIRW